MTLPLDDEALRAIIDGCAKASQFHDGNMMRYEHGGGRLAIIPVPGDGPRHLIADFYHEGDREHFARLDPATVRSLATQALEAQRLREALREANAFILAPAEDLKDGVLHRIRAALSPEPSKEQKNGQ